MKVLLIEDEIHAVKRLSALLRELDSSIEVIGNLDSISSSIRWLQEKGSPDLIFLDIHLADGNSFLLFQHVQPPCPIIFATAYDEYAIQAFKVNSIDYLLKPIEKEELERALKKFRLQSRELPAYEYKIHEVIQSFKLGKKEYKQRFLVKIADRLVPVHVEQARYFFAEEKLVFLQTEDKKYPIDFTLEELEELLDPKLFFRLNRKFLSHIHSIDKIFHHVNGKLKLILKPLVADEIFVSREKATEFKAWLEA